MAAFSLKSFLSAYRQGLEMVCPVRNAAERTVEALERKRQQTAEVIERKRQITADVIDRKRKMIDKKISETSSLYAEKAKALRERR